MSRKGRQGVDISGVASVGALGPCTTASSSPPHELLGQSPFMREVRKAIRRVAPTNQPVLIRGETGTGKTLAAENVHSWSRRSVWPLVVLDCSSAWLRTIPGSRAGLTRPTDTFSRFLARAEGGTLLIEQLGLAPPPLQARLVELMELRDRPRHMCPDFRLVATAGPVLEQPVSEGSIRKDLFYVLAKEPVPMPALRDHVDDIPLLVEHFITCLDQTGRAFSGEAVRMLKQHTWPGNVRELKNLVHRMLAMVDDRVVEVQHLPVQYGGRECAASSEGADPGKRKARCLPRNTDPRWEHRRPRVLAVDDDDAIRRVLGMFLRRLGCEVVLAADGLEAIDRLLTEEFDLG